MVWFPLLLCTRAKCRHLLLEPDTDVLRRMIVPAHAASPGKALTPSFGHGFFLPVESRRLI